MNLKTLGFIKIYVANYTAFNVNIEIALMILHYENYKFNLQNNGKVIKSRQILFFKLFLKKSHQIIK